MATSAKAKPARWFTQFSYSLTVFVVRGGKGRHAHISRGRACGANQSRVDQLDADSVGTWHVIIAQIVAGWTIFTLLVAVPAFFSIPAGCPLLVRVGGGTGRAMPRLH